MILKKPQDIFRLPFGERVTKRNLFDLIKNSKEPNSDYWEGKSFRIGNTPQQGINWIGSPPNTRGVIIKTRPGAYEHDGWLDSSRDCYRYSFKSRKSEIYYHETANSVLISQPQHLYPIFLFVEDSGEWIYEGRFSVSEIGVLWVVLNRGQSSSHLLTAPDEEIYREGGRKYVTHLMVERSRRLVAFLKKNSEQICEICGLDYAGRYGVEYIEAHHKVPISTFTSEHIVKPEHLALLCPNCHKAVHIIMKQRELEYEAIQDQLISRLEEAVTKRS